MIGSYYTTSFSMLYITLHYKCKIHVLYQIIQYCLILKKNVVYDAPKHLKIVQYSTNTPTPTLSQWAKTWPSIIIREIYLINKIITKRSKCQCFLKKKNKILAKRNCTEKNATEITRHTFSESIEEGEKIAYGSSVFEVYITIM